MGARKRGNDEPTLRISLVEISSPARKQGPSITELRRRFAVQSGIERGAGDERDICELCGAGRVLRLDAALWSELLSAGAGPPRPVVDRRGGGAGGYLSRAAATRMLLSRLPREPFQSFCRAWRAWAASGSIQSLSLTHPWARR